MRAKLSRFIEKKHPEKILTSRASTLFNDTCLSHFQNMKAPANENTEMNPQGQNR